MAVDRLKDSVFAALCRFDHGDGALILPAWLPDDLLEEHVAEESTDKGWRKKEGMSRNEAIDHAVQALALAEHKGAHRINYADSCPPWAEASPLNSFAVDLAAPDLAAPGIDPETVETAATQSPRPERSSAPRRIKYLRR
jgi:phage terminase large subunit GpA-like protein